MSYCSLKGTSINIRLRQTPNEITTSFRNIAPCSSIIIPVFCECLISAIGRLAGLRHAIFMQFNQDADTEYIGTQTVTKRRLQPVNFEKSSH